MKVPLSKYIIYAKLEVSGLVERHDVIGAIFGQMEGLLGPEMDLNELLKAGKIGRIEIELKHEKTETLGTISIPSNLDRVSTALLAATLEQVDRIGPYSCKITFDKIVDIREEKRSKIKERAKQILHEWTLETKPQIEEIIKEVTESSKSSDLIAYGSEKLPATPGIEKAKSIIVVEGRADIIHLLKHGYKDIIALEGATIPNTIVKLSKEKETTVFLNGDRSANLILKNLIRVADIDFVARAPLGKEVEELTADEIAEALENKVPIKTVKGLETTKYVR